VLDLRLARLPSRAIAIAIDLAVTALVAVGLGLLLNLSLPAADDALAAALNLIAVVTVLVAVPVTVETLTRGRSLGKLALGLRVVRDDGGTVRFRHALARGLAGVFVDFWTTLGCGALVCSLVNSRGKRFGDLLAGTVVVRERVPAARDRVPEPPESLRAWSATLELSQLPDDLALAARSYLTRLPQLAPDVRDSMGSRLATAVSARITPPPPAGTPAWAYLAAVLAERSRRQQLRREAHASAPPVPATGPYVGRDRGSYASPGSYARPGSSASPGSHAVPDGQDARPNLGPHAVPQPAAMPDGEQGSRPHPGLVPGPPAGLRPEGPPRTWAPPAQPPPPAADSPPPTTPGGFAPPR
jgi:uncharacterized RDD family membrane protein YckC